MSEVRTVTLREAFAMSSKIAEAAIESMETLSDGTLARALGLMSGSSLARALDLMSDSNLARALDLMSGSSLASALGLMSGSSLASALGLMSDSSRASVQLLAGAVVPVIDGLDAKVCEAVERDGINMSSWHCGTTHCRAGWAVALAGENGAALEALIGTEVAGRLIYEASTGRIAPDFFASNEEALADIARCAGKAG